MAMPMDGNLHTMSVPFTGVVAGSRVTLNLQTGLSGSSSKLSGTLSGSHLGI